MFECGIHDFKTESFDEYNQHLENEVHTTTGTTPCNYCGKPAKLDYTGKRSYDQFPAICDDCKDKIENTKKSLGI